MQALQQTAYKGELMVCRCEAKANIIAVIKRIDGLISGDSGD